LAFGLNRASKINVGLGPGSAWGGHGIIYPHRMKKWGTRPPQWGNLVLKEVWGRTQNTSNYQYLHNYAKVMRER